MDVPAKVLVLVLEKNSYLSTTFLMILWKLKNGYLQWIIQNILHTQTFQVSNLLWFVVCILILKIFMIFPILLVPPVQEENYEKVEN